MKARGVAAKHKQTVYGRLGSCMVVHSCSGSSRGGACSRVRWLLENSQCLRTQTNNQQLSWAGGQSALPQAQRRLQQRLPQTPIRGILSATQPALGQVANLLRLGGSGCLKRLGVWPVRRHAQVQAGAACKQCGGLRTVTSVETAQQRPVRRHKCIPAAGCRAQLPHATTNARRGAARHSTAWHAQRSAAHPAGSRLPWHRTAPAPSP